MINFGHLTHERAEYNTLAVVLVTSVNVDSGIARTERQNLLDLARRTTGSYHAGRKGCLVRCGHGPVSMIEEKPPPFGNIEHYLPGG